MDALASFSPAGKFSLSGKGINHYMSSDPFLGMDLDISGDLTPQLCSTVYAAMVSYCILSVEEFL